MKILVIRFSSLGDLVLMTPLLKALKTNLPGSRIHLACKDMYSSLFENINTVDRIHHLKEGNTSDLLRLRSRLSREKFDIIIDAHNVVRSNLLYHSLRANRKVQIQKEQLRKFLLIHLKIDRYREEIHQTERYLNLARMLGIEPSDTSTELRPGRKNLVKAGELLKSELKEGKKIVAVAPGARWETKRWPKEYYIKLIDKLIGSKISIILIGGKGDMDLSEDIAEAVERPPLNLTGKLSISQTAACLSYCCVIITNDSAPMHLAESVGTPTVTLYGPTVKQFGYFPTLPESTALEFPLQCRPCSRNGSRQCRLNTRECLTAIKPELVEKQIHKSIRLTYDEEKDHVNC